MSPDPNRTERKQPPLDAEIWTAEEVAGYLGVSDDTVRSEAKKKKLPGFQVGSMWRFRAEKIRALGA